MSRLSFTLDDFPTADFILLTSDGIRLYVHRAVLEISSIFFRDMFALPQPRPICSPSLSNASMKMNMGLNENDDDGELPLVKITEDAETMGTILTLIYPLPSSSSSGSESTSNTSLTTTLSSPTLTPLQTLSHLIHISQKYLLSSAIEKLSSVLLERARKDRRGEALRVYAIGCREDLGEVVRGASRECLGVGFDELFGCGAAHGEDDETGHGYGYGFERKEGNGGRVWKPKRAHTVDPLTLSSNSKTNEILKEMSAWDYRLLLHLHRHRTQLILSLLNSLPNDLPPPPCHQCSSTAHFGLSLPPKWFLTFLQRAPGELERWGPSVDSEWMFREELVRDCVKGGCARCGSSYVLEGRPFLEKLKERIGEIEDCVEWRG